MTKRPVIQSIYLLAVLLSPASMALPLQKSDDWRWIPNQMESIYNATISVLDDIAESMQTMKLKCRQRTENTYTCHIEDYKYQKSREETPWSKLHLGHLKLIPSSDPFEIKYRSSSVESLTVSETTSPMHLNIYRAIASHLFPGVDVTGKPNGTYSLIEQSVYGKCQAFVKVMRSGVKDNNVHEEKLFTESVSKIPDSNLSYEILSIKRTRNLDSCHPLPGLIIFNPHFHVTSTHWQIKSSISRTILSTRAFTSYTTEDIAVRDADSDRNTTMLHLRTTLTLLSVDPAERPIPRISKPISVQLPFAYSFIGVDKRI